MGMSVGLVGDDCEDEPGNIWEYAYGLLSLYNKFNVDNYAKENDLSVAEAMRQYFRDDLTQAFEGGNPPAWYDAIEAKEKEHKRKLLLQVRPYRQVIDDALNADPTSFDEEIRKFDELRGFPNRSKRV